MANTAACITLSIQIRLGGFSFSVCQDAVEVSSGVVDGFDFSMLDPRRWGRAAYDRAVVWCDVPWATMVPIEVYRPESTELYLDALNLLATDRQAMAAQQGAVVVVWAIDQAVVDAFCAAVPAIELEWTHPLLWLLESPRRRSIGVWAGGETLHATVFDDRGLVGGRSLTFAQKDDVLYTLVQMTMGCDRERSFDLSVSGVIDAAMETALKSCYPQVQIVHNPLALVRSL